MTTASSPPSRAPATPAAPAIADPPPLTYRLGIHALPDAAPGLRSDDGGLLIGRLAPVPLSARVEE
ncbi:hypothetical protein AB0O76_24415 [Streptomyces sp. NPDC086554]|uniref:hypothetical protein n=1 Tax=Streptomyces sp. NPDC086554 TaxID=3154864 RepID=UPI003432A647